MRMRKLLTAALVLAAWILPPATAGMADGPEDPLRFLAVEEWRLTFAYESDDPHRWNDRGTIIDRQVLRVSESGAVTLRRASTNTYKGEGSMTCSLEWVEERRPTNWFYRDERRGSGTPKVRATLTFDPRKGTYDLDVRADEITITKHSIIRDHLELRHDGTSTYGWRPTPLPFPPTKWAPALPPKGLVITGSYSQEEDHKARGHDPETVRRKPPSRGTGRWTLIPGNVPDVELVVLSRDYETWRPQAGEREQDPGNRIEIEARLQGSEGRPPQVKAQRIIFELSDTSREPGVTMNFPLGKAASNAPDLKFAPSPGDSSHPPLELSEDAQRAETVPGEHTQARAAVVSFDWGGWSTLKVFAELPDGRRISGHLGGGAGPSEIPLPKRTQGSRIADSWKATVGVSAPDDDDSEPVPGGGPALGDGFTLFEEYRGFRANGRHVAGNPTRIDFFVRDYIGPDAQPGIDLFARLTGAEVHTPLTDAEFDREVRVMNANHDQGAHRVDQHGVGIATKLGQDGAVTLLSKAKVRGRPSITIGINVQPRGALTGVTTSENVPLSDLVFAYDRAVAHELLHTVGAEHHGTGDEVLGLQLVLADDRRNPTGKPYFRYPGIGDAKVSITDETTGVDIALVWGADMMLMRERVRQIFYPDCLEKGRRMSYDYPRADGASTPKEFAENCLNDVMGLLPSFFYAGAEHGESSGDDACVMRYYFAKVYAKKGTRNAYYWISNRRSERAGLDLCRSGAGTGVNDKGRRPRPRYGDAGPGRGACVSTLIFNDALPLVSDQ